MPDEIIGTGQANLDSFSSDAPLDQLFTPDFVDHDPGTGQPAGGEGLMWWWKQFGESFSDVEHDVIHTVATPEHVITVMNLTGRHTGEWMGHAATGRTFSVRNVQVMRFVDGKRAERWGSTDQLGILEQLGLA